MSGDSESSLNSSLTGQSVALCDAHVAPSNPDHSHWDITAELLLYDVSYKSYVLLRCDHAGSAVQWHMLTSHCCNTLLLALIQPGSMTTMQGVMDVQCAGGMRHKCHNCLTEGTARTANLKTSCPLMAMLVKEPSAEAPVLLRGFSPSWLK